LPAAFSLSIQPWGEVALCLGRDETIIGNIKESDLMQLWRNKKTFMIQRMLRNEKKNCVCWTANNQQLSQLLAVLKLI
jgi:radical SAM protein with 4Fe4S-binding SPASM domain